MEVHFDGLTAFQTEDNDILVTADNRPVLHIYWKKRLSKKALEKNVREVIAMVMADRKARDDTMKLYDAVCPVCGKLNKSIYLEETGDQMECDKCGTVVDLSLMPCGRVVPSQDMMLRVKIAGTVAC